MPARRTGSGTAVVTERAYPRENASRPNTARASNARSRTTKSNPAMVARAHNLSELTHERRR
eukprot:7291659-Lingulodinium_polyedra.AAC.1